MEEELLWIHEKVTIILKTEKTQEGTSQIEYPYGL